MQFIILLLHVLVCVSLIALVLLQQGKGADIGAAFGSGASQTVFGSTGSGSFLMKFTGLLAAVFFATSIFLGHLDSTGMKQTQFQLPTSKQTNTQSIVIPGEKTKTTQIPASKSNGVASQGREKK